MDSSGRKIYINGIENAATSTAFSGITANRILVGGDLYNQESDGGYRVGRRRTGFNGVVDELALFNRFLADSEILDHYKRGALKLTFQVRSCNDSACSGETFIGPDGTALTYYSEIDNNTLNPPNFNLTNISKNRYFQYKAFFETSDNSFSPELVSVTINYDTPGITVSPTSGLVTTESGGTANFTVVLNTQPTDDVTINLSSSDPTEGTVSPTSLTFTPSNWSTPQTVIITGVDDSIVDGNIVYTIITSPASSADSNYNNLDPDDVSVTNNNNDEPPPSAGGVGLPPLGSCHPKNLREDFGF
jgi:hypothetical protein